MIISYEHNFIFVHCRKVAGTSVAATLSQILGPKDIHVGTWPKSFDNGVMPNRRFYLDLLNTSATLEIAKRVLSKPRSVLKVRRLIYIMSSVHTATYERHFNSPAHPTAAEFKLFDGEAWNSFFKFCFVRNPYERAVSDYLFLSAKKGFNISFLEFLRRLEEQMQGGPVFQNDFDNWPMYTLANKVAVDYIGRYESLARDFEEILNKLGLQDRKLSLPYLNTSPNRYNDFREFYCESGAELAVVERLFKPEIEMFGYRFT